MNSLEICTYTAGQSRYYNVKLLEGDALTVALENVEATWVLYDADGNAVANSTTGNTYTATTGADYYLVVTATAASADGGATMTLSVPVAQA